jgi:transglutaminase-like putative cysteine protease
MLFHNYSANMKSQLFEVTHTTVYRYVSVVSVSHNVVRLAPRLLDRQRPLSHRIELTPPPSVVSVHTDYFGNEVHFATIDEAHQELRVTAQSTVAVGPSAIPDVSETQPWERVYGRCLLDHSKTTLEATEFTFPSPHVPVAPAYADYARPSFTAGRPILEAVIDLTSRIHRDFTFDSEATTLATPLEEVLKNRRGVCQDFAHFQIACLRSLGLPARYVSGYLETLPPPGQQKLMGADASHAWISFYCPGIGWIDADPTNDVLPSMQHITVAWGRDYGDVSPIHGVASGGGDHQLDVAVNVVAKGVIETAG